MVRNNIVIDAHSHFGSDYFHGDTDLYQYIDMMENTGIDYAILMPTPCPVKFIDYAKCKYLGWYLNGNKIAYYSDINLDDVSNPFQYVNYSYFEFMKNTERDNLFFAPLVHPMLDSCEYLEQMIRDIDPVALKIHGVGCGVDPRMIPDEFTEIIRKYNIPLIIHTDYDNGNQILRYDTFLLRNLNRPMIWIDYLNNARIKGVLNHGCALDRNSFEKINDIGLIKVGLGPDLIIEHDLDRLMVKNCECGKIDYLNNLKQMLLDKKIVFDVDFNWNVNPYGLQMDLEYLKRIIENWPDFCAQKQIFSGNILEHFDKLKIKIKEGMM